MVFRQPFDRIRQVRDTDETREVFEDRLYREALRRRQARAGATARGL